LAKAFSDVKESGANVMAELLRGLCDATYHAGKSRKCERSVKFKL
jgi:hypothetical protein